MNGSEDFAVPGSVSVPSKHKGEGGILTYKKSNIRSQNNYNNLLKLLVGEL